jgi:hypothetical protein
MCSCPPKIWLQSDTKWSNADNGTFSTLATLIPKVGIMSQPVRTAGPASAGTISLLHLVQLLATSGARCVLPFVLEDQTCLAVAQLAEDKPGEPPYMNGGNSNIPLLLFRWTGEHFDPWLELPASGSEDAEFFRIGERSFLATASLRSGSGPYEINTNSTLFEWKNGTFETFQQFPTFAAKQWRAFAIGQRHFLALAQGVVMEGLVATNPSESIIFEWNGTSFQFFQTVPSAWGYNWTHFQIEDEHYLAYADHAKPSIILRWNGASFQEFQTLEGKSGRSFHFFESGGESYLAFAVLQGDTLLYRWSEGKFIEHQTLSGPGGREFTSFVHHGNLYLVQVNFLTGSPKTPKTDLDSVIYRFENGRFTCAECFPTNGATDAAVFRIGARMYLAISESLTAEVRFRASSKVFEIA